MSHRKRQCPKVMHACCKNSAENNPQKCRQPSPINSDRRANDRSRSSNGTEVMSPQNKLIRRNKINAVFITMSRRSEERRVGKECGARRARERWTNDSYVIGIGSG